LHTDAALHYSAMQTGDVRLVEATHRSGEEPTVCMDFSTDPLTV